MEKKKKTITSNKYRDLYINLEVMKAYVKNFTRENYQSLLNEDMEVLKHLWHIERKIGLAEQLLERMEDSELAQN